VSVSAIVGPETHKLPSNGDNFYLIICINQGFSLLKITEIGLPTLQYLVTEIHRSRMIKFLSLNLHLLGVASC